MTILKKRLLPLLLATCIGAGTVSTCDAGWEILNYENIRKFVTPRNMLKAFLGSAAVGFLHKNVLQKNKTYNDKIFPVIKVLGIGLMVGMVIYGIYTLYKIRALCLTNLKDACTNGDYDKVKDILDENKDAKNLDYWIKRNSRESSLYHACKHGDLKLVKLLIERLTDKKLVNDATDKSILEGALQNTKLDENGNSEGENIFKFLVEGLYKDLDYSQKENEYILSPIHVACKVKRFDRVQWLVGTKQFNVNLECCYEHEKGLDSKVTPLHIACESGDLDLVKYLVEKGANALAKTGRFKLPIHYACDSGHPALVKYFIEDLKTEINDHDKKACLFLAVESGNLELFNYLVGKSVELYGKTYPNNKIQRISGVSLINLFEGKTLLDVALKSKNINFEIIKTLLEFREGEGIKDPIKFKRKFEVDIDSRGMHDSPSLLKKHQEFTTKLKALKLDVKSNKVGVAIVTNGIYESEFEFTVGQKTVS